MIATTHARRALVAFMASAALLGAVGVPAVAAPSAAPAGHSGYGTHSGYGDFARLSHQKAVTVRVLKGLFERGDTGVVDRYVRPGLIQHNPLAPDGAKAPKNLGTALHQKFPDAKYDIKRVMSEGDLVLVHSNVVMTPGERGKAVFDIFRFQGGKIAEQWNVAQDVPETSVNGNDMFSTESWPRTEQPGPAWLTEYNKKVATKAFDELMVHKDLSAIDRYYGPEYHQHNPTVPDGVEGAKAGLGGPSRPSRNWRSPGSG
ncbi:nuclear transport factor 2 family protein [Streptomyces sp. DG2A-72]|uniref:nuclear transport factor 2 family protein n=1 Tax=Streptomyces sp. DG2A-72 TaxID=3051386 RepID=UPI003464A7E6